MLILTDYGCISTVDVGPVYGDINQMIPSALSDVISDAIHDDNESFKSSI